jgi:hypothetical protein
MFIHISFDITQNYLRNQYYAIPITPSLNLQVKLHSSSQSDPAGWQSASLVEAPAVAVASQGLAVPSKKVFSEFILDQS